SACRFHLSSCPQPRARMGSAASDRACRELESDEPRRTADQDPAPRMNQSVMKDLLRDVTEVRPVGGYQLYLCFDDGASGVVDLAALLQPFHGVFEPPREPSYFEQVRVNSDIGTICWPNDADIAPETLYALLTASDVGAASDAENLLLTSNS